MEKLVILLMSLLLVACQKSVRENISEIENEMSAMQTHRVRLNLGEMLCCVPDNDTARIDAVGAQYRFVVYADSLKCSPCIISRMYMWNDLIDMTRKMNGKVDYVFIFEPKKEQVEDAVLAVESSGLKNRIYIDTACVFRERNRFIPKDEKFHAMLINEMDSIVLVGMPLTNHKVKELFLHIINTN